MTFSGETLHFAFAEHVAEPAGVGPRMGEPVDVERHRRLGGRRGLPFDTSVDLTQDALTQRGAAGEAARWVTSAPPCSRSSAPSCSPSCSWCSSCCRRWARSRRPRRTSRKRRRRNRRLTVQRNALEDTKANEPENRKIIEQVHHQIPPTADEAGLFSTINKAALDSGLDLVVNITPSTPTFDDEHGAQHHRAPGERRRDVQRRHGLQLSDRDAAARGEDHGAQPVAGRGADHAHGRRRLLTMTATIEAYTSDTSAGPGSEPGPTEAG